MEAKNRISVSKLIKGQKYIIQKRLEPNGQITGTFVGIVYDTDTNYTNPVPSHQIFNDVERNGKVVKTLDKVGTKRSFATLDIWYYPITTNTVLNTTTTRKVPTTKKVQTATTTKKVPTATTTKKVPTATTTTTQKVPTAKSSSNAIKKSGGKRKRTKKNRT
jgi:hypothetical protein